MKKFIKTVLYVTAVIIGVNIVLFVLGFAAGVISALAGCPIV